MTGRMHNGAGTDARRSRGAHRAEPVSLFRRGVVAKAGALGLLGALAVGAPVVATSVDGANAVAAKATSTTDSPDAVGSRTAAAKDAPASDAPVEDPAGRDRTAADRASRATAREPLAEDKAPEPLATAKAPAPEATAKAPEPVAVAEPPAPDVVMPVAAGDYRLTSRYGARWGSEHLGVDFAAPLDTPIHAVADGVVTYVGAGKDGRSSMMITVRHEVDGKTFESWYVHMYSDDLYVSVGQKVKAGEVIAGVGNNGFSTGPHLHFEIHPEGGDATTEPLAWMDSLGAVDVSKM